MAGAMCSKVADSSQEVCCPIHPAIMSWNKTFHSIAGGKRGRFCWCSVCAVCSVSRGLARSCAVLRRLAPSCRLRRLARWCEMVQMVSTAKQPRYADRNVSFQPARSIPSLCWCLPPVPPASAKQGDRDCYFLFRQNVCTSSSSSRSRSWSVV